MDFYHSDGTGKTLKGIFKSPIQYVIIDYVEHMSILMKTWQHVLKTCEIAGMQKENEALQSQNFVYSCLPVMCACLEALIFSLSQGEYQLRHVVAMLITCSRHI